MIFIEDKTFEKCQFQERPLDKGEYENCSFKQCDFSNTDLSGIRFQECQFVDCNLSLAKIAKTSFQDCIFSHCKMLGLRWDQCDEFGLTFRFENCQLNHSSFYKTKIKKTYFGNCQLQEVDFTECDLSGSEFVHCDLLKALFDRTILEKVDLRMAAHFSIDPENNRIKKAKFSIYGLPGLLHQYDIEVDSSH